MTKEKIISMIFTVIAIPLTIWGGMYFLNDRKFYFISILIILEIFVPFMFMLENKKYKARELVIISVMAALAVVGRVAFAAVFPNFQAMTAIIMIAGIALGANAGFLVGAVAAFVSNFFSMQGPWTPWQMFAWGITGFLSGLIFKRTDIKGIAAILAVYGFIVTVAVYGFIMNIQSALTMMPEFNLGAIITCIVRGLPFDLIHGGSTAACLLIAGKPILSIMYRIKTKYGIKTE